MRLAALNLLCALLAGVGWLEILLGLFVSRTALIEIIITTSLSIALVKIINHSVPIIHLSIEVEVVAIGTVSTHILVVVGLPRF